MNIYSNCCAQFIWLLTQDFNSCMVYYILFIILYCLLAHVDISTHCIILTQMMN